MEIEDKGGEDFHSKANFALMNTGPSTLCFYSVTGY